MATMWRIGSEGQKEVMLGPVISLPPRYEVPSGKLLSWEHQFLTVASDKQKDAVLMHGKARIFVSLVMTSLIVRIESPRAGDLLGAIEFMVKYLGGMVATFNPPPPASPDTNSFVAGVRNDLMRLWYWVRSVTPFLRQPREQFWESDT